MPSIKRRLRQRREWCRSHLRQLSCGHDFFGDAWGDYLSLPLDKRGEWLTPDIYEDMAACWAQHGKAIKASEAEPCWGELVFDRGMSGREALLFGANAITSQHERN